MKKIILIVLSLLAVSALRAELYINEFMADNDNIVVDNAGDYDDWIELYNDYDYAVQLSGYYLTDDYGNPTQWPLPDVSIPAKGYMIIWADDQADQGALHANFKLSANGEQIGLYHGDAFLDSLTFGEQTTDVSFGRYPDGAASWYFMAEPTPGAENRYTSTEITEAPVFQPGPGFYTDDISVELSVSHLDATIRYTLDGAEPNPDSPLYTSPILVTGTTVIRAKTFRAGYDPSDISTASYIIRDDFDIATLSVVTDPENLWDTETGIYTNWEESGDEWERSASIEFFGKDDALEFSYNVGLRIHGGWSRSLEKKSFRYYFRSEYGQSWLYYQLFKAKELDRYKRFVTSAAFGNSFCLDDYGTLLRDPLHQLLGRRLEPDIGLGTHPVALYLNGEPWGLYNAIEHIDDEMLETNFGMTEADIIENYDEAKQGSEDRFDAMIAFFEANDFENDENYETAKTMIDMQNFTRYNVMEIWGGNRDWPDNNNIAYCGYEEGDRWKWFLWDFDKSMDYFSTNSLVKAIDENTACTIILRKLLDNENYRNYFINETADAYNTILLASRVVPAIDSLAALIRNDIWFEAERWDGDAQKWEANVADMKTYAENRLEYLYKYTREEFGISANHTLTLSVPQGGAGRVRVNSIYLAQFPWSGIYFDGIPIELEAIPTAGCQFREWSDASLPKTPTVSVTLTRDYSVYPIFECSGQTSGVVINEINYNSAGEFDADDWVELHNTSDNPVNVSNWHFRDDDENHDFIFPGGTTIPAHGFLVLCMDMTKFSSLFPGVTPIIGNVDFGLGGGGDDVRIYDFDMNLADSVTYDDSAPWPTEPDGAGATLELLDANSDNSLAENWGASLDHGTPGQFNSISAAGAIADLRASVLDDAILLEWTEPDGMASFHVYRDTTYNFSPDKAAGSNRIGESVTDQDGSAAGIQWTDTGQGADVVGDVSTNYFYRVTAVSAMEYAPSNVAGEFDYQLVTTSGTDINRLVVLMNTANTRLPIATAEDLAQAIPNCTDVYWWDASGQGTVGHVKGLPFNNFSVQPGHAYSVSVTEDTVWTVAGSYADVSFNLVTTEGTDINRIGVPLAKAALTTADQLGADIPNCTDVYLWDAVGQGTLGHVVGLPFNNFAVRAGYAYAVSITAPTVWPDDGVGGGASLTLSSPCPMKVAVDEDFVEFRIPHTVYGEYQQPRPGARVPSIRAWMLSRPHEVLTDANFGIGVEKNQWWVGVSNFVTKWEVGDSLMVEIFNKDSETCGSTLVVLSNAGSDNAGRILLTGVSDESGEDRVALPGQFALRQNYPNPFNPSTTIAFDLPVDCMVTFTIHNARAQLVTRLIEKEVSAGQHTVQWNAADEKGRPVQNGVYFGTLTAGEFSRTIKMIVVK
ncbi:MAG: CotH kinase family protein [Candidatus Zhuqueibacterota bacterium]